MDFYSDSVFSSFLSVVFGVYMNKYMFHSCLCRSIAVMLLYNAMPQEAVRAYIPKGRWQSWQVVLAQAWHD